MTPESKQFLAYVAAQPKGRVGYHPLRASDARKLAAECVERGFVKERRHNYGLGFQITEWGRQYLAGERG
jgi:hypothetical protein